MTTWTNQSKSSATLTNQVKSRVATWADSRFTWASSLITWGGSIVGGDYANQYRGEYIQMWASSYFPWTESEPWITRGEGFSNQSKS